MRLEDNGCAKQEKMRHQIIPTPTRGDKNATIPSNKRNSRIPHGGKSYFYVMDQRVIIVDEGIRKCDSKEDVFPYTLITDKQNYYMHHYEKVFRFLAEDVETIKELIQNTKANVDVDFTSRVANREENADASPLELLFEKNFANVYGMNSLKYFWKEYGIIDNNGNNYF